VTAISFSACGENDLEQVGNCTPAKRLPAEKYEDNIASNAYNPTQLSSTKLVKHIKKERLTFSLSAYLKTYHRLLRSYLTSMCKTDPVHKSDGMFKTCSLGSHLCGLEHRFQRCVGSLKLSSNLVALQLVLMVELFWLERAVTPAVLFAGG
jgi:hypothetical protein